MQIQRLPFLRSEEIAAGTMAFYFEKPSDFVYKAGQYMDWAVLNPAEVDNGGDVRTLSIASAPHEPEFMIATRMRDSVFKKTLKKLQAGDEIETRGMGGSFTLHNNDQRAAIFFAGGIGITPFRSMIADAMFRKLSHRIILFYSNRDAESAPFLKELETFAAENPRFTLVPIFTATTGRITTEIIREHTKEVDGTALPPIYYIAGSMDMVTSMRGLLNEMGIDDDDIRAEDFPGY